MSLAIFAMTALLAAAPVVAPRSPTNDEINAAEAGNPDSPDYRNRPALEITGDVNAEWQALEAGNPEAVQPGNSVSVATTPRQGSDAVVATTPRQGSDATW